MKKDLENPKMPGPPETPRKRGRPPKAREPAATGMAEGDTISTDELADLLGITPNRVGVLAREDTLPQLSRGRFSRRAAVRAYCEKLRRDQIGRPSSNPELSAEKLRLARANADKVELANAKARRELVAIADVESAWGAVLRDVRAAMLAIPARVQQRLGHLTVHDVQLIDREVRDALELASEFKNADQAAKLSK